VASVRPAS